MRASASVGGRFPSKLVLSLLGVVFFCSIIGMVTLSQLQAQDGTNQSFPPLRNLGPFQPVNLHRRAEEREKNGDRTMEIEEDSVLNEQEWNLDMGDEEMKEVQPANGEGEDEEDVGHSETEHNLRRQGEETSKRKDEMEKGTQQKDSEFEDVEYFVMFIGYPRSGHTLIGSFLDAHPNIVIAHEYNVLDRYINDPSISREYLFNSLVHSSLHFGEKGHVNQGYNYRVPNQWQGRWNRTISVIGDKRGGATTRTFFANYLVSIKVVKQLAELVKSPMKWIHVIRNPFDNIATIATRSLDPSKSSAFWKENPPNMPRDLLQQAINTYFASAHVNHKLHTELPGEVIDIIYEEFIADTTKGFERLCNFLPISRSSSSLSSSFCSPGYVKDCSSIVYPSPTRSRHFFVWPEDLRLSVEGKMTKYPFFSSYSWDK